IVRVKAKWLPSNTQTELAFNAGAGLVIQESENQQEGQDSIVEQLTTAFERDWFSPYTISLLPGKDCQNFIIIV
uniref:Uncharacterized protein n=1 Tax=Sinocyclocheilus rhinocerous TaxID=307959 RepID=A0A673K1Y1_9TELE